MAVAVIRLAALRTAVLAALVPAHGVLAQTALLDPTRPANSAMYATTVAGVEPGPSGAGVLQCDTCQRGWRQRGDPAGDHAHPGNPKSTTGQENDPTCRRNQVMSEPTFR